MARDEFEKLVQPGFSRSYQADQQTVQTVEKVRPISHSIVASPSQGPQTRLETLSHRSVIPEWLSSVSLIGASFVVLGMAGAAGWTIARWASEGEPIVTDVPTTAPNVSSLSVNAVESGTVESGTVEPATVEPATVEPATVEPATVEPGTIAAVSSESISPSSNSSVSPEPNTVIREINPSTNSSSEAVALPTQEINSPAEPIAPERIISTEPASGTHTTAQSTAQSSSVASQSSIEQTSEVVGSSSPATATQTPDIFGPSSPAPTIDAPGQRPSIFVDPIDSSAGSISGSDVSVDPTHSSTPASVQRPSIFVDPEEIAAPETEVAETSDVLSKPASIPTTEPEIAARPDIFVNPSSTSASEPEVAVPSDVATSPEVIAEPVPGPATESTVTPEPVNETVSQPQPEAPPPQPPVEEPVVSTPPSPRQGSGTFGTIVRGATSWVIDRIFCP